MKFCEISILALGLICSVAGFPKYETENKNFGYDKGNGGQAEEKSSTKFSEDPIQDESQDRPPRFGFPVYPTDVQGTGNVFPGLYSPVKLDIGGLVLGTIVGLGAVFILPKLFHVVASPYSSYKRSEDEGAGGFGMQDLIEKVQDSLNSYNIDSTACLQRAVCFSVQSTKAKTENHTTNNYENVLRQVVKNNVFNAMINGTDWREAVNIGENGGDCTTVFSKCPQELDSLMSAVTKYLSS